METIEIGVGTENLVGQLFKPDEPSQKHVKGNNVAKLPALVFTGPYTGVKEQVTGTYAKRLATEGFVTLAFDHRNFGESDGVIRQHEEPQKKIDDLSAALGYLAQREDVDSDRIGVVGICLGGSYALRFAGFDPRVKALATVAAAYIGFPATSEEEAENKTEWLSRYSDELNKLALGQPTLVAAVSEDPDVDVGMPGQEPFDYYGTDRSFSPHWRNEITKLSSYNLASFDSVTAARHLQQTPTLVLHGTTDAFCSPENAQRAYDLMSGKKHLEWIKTTNHIELYDSEDHLQQAIPAVANWMHDHL